jgi:hypothetical protein
MRSSPISWLSPLAVLGTALLLCGCPARNVVPAEPDQPQAGAVGEPSVCEAGQPEGVVCALAERIDNREHAAEAARELERLGPEAVAAVPALVRLLKSDEQKEREAAAEALGAIESAEAVDGLIEALKDDDDDVRGDAAEALGLIGDPRAVPALGRALEDPDNGVRWFAADALARIGHKDAIPLLARALDDPEGSVRKEVIRALERLGGGQIPAGVVFPEKVTDDRCRQVAEALERARPGQQLKIAVHAFDGTPCHELAAVADASPSNLLRILAEAQESSPAVCRPVCDEVWDALAAAAPEVKRFLVADACGDSYGYDLLRFTIELQLIRLALTQCERRLDAFEGVVLFGGHSLTHNPKGVRVGSARDLKPGMFAGNFSGLTAWADAIQTVSPAGFRVAWPNLLAVRKGEIAWLDEEAGYRFPGKQASLAEAREALAEQIPIAPVDPPLLAIGVGTNAKQLKEALRPWARLADAPQVVLAKSKCPKGAPTVRVTDENAYEIADELRDKPDACVESFESALALRQMARAIGGGGDARLPAQTTLYLK